MCELGFQAGVLNHHISVLVQYLFTFYIMHKQNEYIYIYIYIYVYTLCIHINFYVYVYLFIHVNICMYHHRQNMHTYIRIYIHTCIPLLTYIHTCMHTWLHAYIPAYRSKPTHPPAIQMHTHTQKRHKPKPFLTRWWVETGMPMDRV